MTDDTPPDPDPGDAMLVTVYTLLVVGLTSVLSYVVGRELGTGFVHGFFFAVGSAVGLFVGMFVLLYVFEYAGYVLAYVYWCIARACERARDGVVDSLEGWAGR